MFTEVLFIILIICAKSSVIVVTFRKLVPVATLVFQGPVCKGFIDLLARVSHCIGCSLLQGKLAQGSANVFCQESYSKYFQVCNYAAKYSTLPL